jgi:hypothetical protein
LDDLRQTRARGKRRKNNFLALQPWRCGVLVFVGRDLLKRPNRNWDRIADDCGSGREWELSVADDSEIEWHREQIEKNRAILDELEAGNTAGGDVFPETQSEIDRLKAQIAQSELIVAAYEKERPGTP